mgnify:CR=1 FL=1
MKATGVVRRIDDLGRVVIPKEIRRTLRIKEGDPLETTLEQLRIIADSLKMLALQDLQSWLFFGILETYENYEK